MILINEVEKQATFYRKQQKVYKYAMQFWQYLCACGNQFEMNDKVLPIQCFNEMETILEAVEQGKINKAAGVINSFKNKQAVIRIGINGDSDRLSASLKRTIRHEIIHYFLWLMDMPHADDDLEFWCLCYAFDGGAYEPLDEDDIEMYQTFKKSYDSEIKKLQDNIKKIIIYSAISHLKDKPAEFEVAIKEDIQKLKKIFNR